MAGRHAALDKKVRSGVGKGACTRDGWRAQWKGDSGGQGFVRGALRGALHIGAHADTQVHHTQVPHTQADSHTLTIASTQAEAPRASLLSVLGQHEVWTK